jgi:polyphenol oxidase
MFKREERHGKFLGYSYQSGAVVFFFGSRFLPKISLSGYFPEWEFCFLKQVHGKAVVEADPDQAGDADAHHTTVKSRALVVQTADCVPILLASDSRVCAIHAGWKGAALNVVAEAKAAFAGDTVRFAALGPHILKSSFEVGRDVAAQLEKAAPAHAGDLVFPHADPGKAYFDLTELIRRQIHTTFGAQVQLLECLEDTMSSVQFHSYRRDGSTASRQYSFVVIKA